MSITITDIKERVNSIDFLSIIENCMIDGQDVLTEMQRKQMLLGVNSLDRKIGKYKNKNYAEKKHAMNPKPGFGFKDLKLTGEFQRSIMVEPRDAEVIFTSNDEKTNEIVNREGSVIFGLTPKNREKYAIKHLEPKANRKIIKILQK